MKNKYIIKIEKSDLNYFEKKALDKNISYNFFKETRNYIYIKINKADFDKFKKYDYFKKAKILRKDGLLFFTDFIKDNLRYFILTSIILILIYTSSLFIFKVNINVNDVNLKQILKYEFDDYKISSMEIKKSFNKIEKIKSKILEKYNNKIEWIEITPNGNIYNISVIQRKKNPTTNIFDRCHYIAKKSGTITSIIANRGVLLVQRNNYVKSGDILISGEVVYNEKIKNNVCASGKINAEVWYNITVSHPLEKKIYNEGKQKSYNLSFHINDKKYQLFKNKYNNAEKILKLGNNNIGISVYKSPKMTYSKKKYSEDEIIKLSENLASEKIKAVISKDAKILSKKILKKYVNNSTMYIELLVSVEEEIGVVEKY